MKKERKKYIKATPEQKLMMIDLYQKGFSVQEIGDKLGYTGTAIWRQLKGKVKLRFSGYHLREETRKKISLIQKGKHHSPRTEFKKGSRPNRSKESYSRGKDHPMWKGGITLLNKKIRHSEEYKLWRLAVFARDNYTCVWCKQTGIYLEADHIKPFAFFPDLRFDINNGRTLCRPCHMKTDTFKRQRNNKGQFISESLGNPTTGT